MIGKKSKKFSRDHVIEPYFVESLDGRLPTLGVSEILLVSWALLLMKELTVIYLARMRLIVIFNLFSLFHSLTHSPISFSTQSSHLGQFSFWNVSSTDVCKANPLCLDSNAVSFDEISLKFVKLILPQIVSFITLFSRLFLLLLSFQGLRSVLSLLYTKLKYFFFGFDEIFFLSIDSYLRDRLQLVFVNNE